MISDSIICQSSLSSGYDTFLIEKDHKEAPTRMATKFTAASMGFKFLISLRFLILPLSHIIRTRPKNFKADEGLDMPRGR